ncbi:MAG: hypothetical protein DHS20C05_08580 [Hyphococcus sp.]|nr:MAG: hypothetical protein DHS20C05_08580 [Marinicaulis sp.]
METHGNYILIGSAVMIVIAFGFLAVLALSSSQAEFDEYDIIFTERVSGLSVGAQVRFNGIQKGEVETLKIDPDNPSKVIATVRVEKDTPVKVDTTAELEPVGFTGLTIIQLVGGSPDKPLLKEVSDDRPPRITADTSGLGAFLEGSGEVLAQASRLLSDENIQNVNDIIANVEILTGAFADNEDQITETLGNINQITTDLAQMSNKLDAAATSLQALLDDDAPETVKEAQALMEDSRALIDDLRGVVEENRGSIRIFADQGLGQVAPAMAELRRLMRTLDYMLREIDRDPQAYFLGENAPEYGAEAEQ